MSFKKSKKSIAKLSNKKPNKNIKNINNKNINTFKFVFILAMSFIMVLSLIATVSAHILIIGDSTGDLPDERKETIAIYQKLISEGYPVVFLVGENATSENIIKGMYNADAVIYIGHGSDLGYYKKDGGTSKEPYALPTFDNIGIWTRGNLLSEGLTWDFRYGGKFIPPFKKGASVIFLHTCFATGWVENTTVSNVDETIYKFNKPYVSGGSNVYSSGYYQAYGGDYFDGVLGQDLANGGSSSISFKDANDNLYNEEDEIQTNSYKQYKKMKFYTSKNNGSLFIGDLNSPVLPNAKDCSDYDEKSADRWYNSGKPSDDPVYNQSIAIKSSEKISKNGFDYFIDLFFDTIDILINT